MKQPKILVVEDEGVVATDIEECLRKLGYRVVASAATAVSAIRKAVENEPDLVLMDIRLKGPMDGVDAAGELHGRLGIPVVFLTAYADAEILERAKKTCPSGYILKPFDERSLRSAIEIALHKHPHEQRLVENERRLVMALRSINEAVILTEPDGAISLMNRPAEALTGWKQTEAAGRNVKDVFVTVHATRGSLLSDPVGRVLREGVGIGLGDRRVLVNRHGAETWIRGSAVPLRDSEGETVGAALVFHSADVHPAECANALRSLESSRMETAGRLAANVAQAFSETLHAVEECGAALLARFGADAAARSEIEAMLATVAEGSRLAGQLTRYTQRRLPRPSIFPLNDALSGLDGLLECAAGENVQILTAFDPNAGAVVADRGHLEHVVLNLVAEARNAMAGAGKLTIETRPAGARAVLAVSHTGGCAEAGDPENKMPDLVELIALAGGKLRVLNEPGRLTTYEIHLPCSSYDFDE